MPKEAKRKYTNEAFVSPFDFTSEPQLWAHIDHALAQAKDGEGRDADNVIDDLMRDKVKN